MGKKMDTTAGAITIYIRQAEPDHTFSGYKIPRSFLPGIVSFPIPISHFFPSLSFNKKSHAFLSCYFKFQNKFKLGSKNKAKQR